MPHAKHTIYKWPYHGTHHVFWYFLDSLENISQLVRAQGKWQKKGDDCRLTVQRANWASWNLVHCPKHALPLSVRIVTDNTSSHTSVCIKHLRVCKKYSTGIWWWGEGVGLNTRREPTYVWQIWCRLHMGCVYSQCSINCPLMYFWFQ